MTVLSRISPDLTLNDELAERDFVGSPMCTNGMSLLKFANDHDGIQLTKSGFFYRKFVTWAAEQFQWPDYEPARLYELNRVLDEQDFPPLSTMHDLMWLGRLLKHTKGKATLTSDGRKILGQFGTLQALLFETYFTVFDFSGYERFPNLIGPSDYRHFLGVTSNRLDEWTSLEEFANWCLPVPSLTSYRTSPASDACWFLMARLVRPLKWLGMIEEQPGKHLSAIEHRRIRKAPLFEKFLRFGSIQSNSLSVH